MMFRGVTTLGLFMLFAGCAQQVEEVRDPGDAPTMDGVAAPGQPSPQPAQSVDQPDQQPLPSATLSATPPAK
jgi:hypothetical protein